MKKEKILLIDDHALMRMGLASLLSTCKQLEVIGQADSGKAGIELARNLQPDVIILDLMMPGMDGVETTERLIKNDPSTKILILTTFGTADGIAHALRCGAKGAIMKSAEFSELITAIQTVASGQTYISAEIEQIITEDPPVPILSPRQTDILNSITRGLSNEDIAKQLNISIQMVKEHLRALFAKIGAANRTEAAVIAMRKHLMKT